MKWLLTLIGALGLLIPSSVWAVNGAGCNYSGDPPQFVTPSGGMMLPIWCVILVDNTTSGSGGPVIYSLGENSTRGVPDAISFLVGTDEDCTAGTVTITTSEVKGGVENDLTSPNPTLDLAGTGTTRINVNTHDAPIGAFVNTRWTAVSGCSGGFDILMIGYENKR